MPRNRPTSLILRSASRSAAAAAGTPSPAAGIFETTRRVFELAAGEGVPAAAAADRLAERRMSEVGRLRGIWLPR